MGRGQGSVGGRRLDEGWGDINQHVGRVDKEKEKTERRVVCEKTTDKLEILYSKCCKIRRDLFNRNTNIFIRNKYTNILLNHICINDSSTVFNRVFFILTAFCV